MGEFSARKFAAILLGAGALVLLPLALFLLTGRQVRAVSPIDKLYLKLCARLEKLGVSRATGEAPQAFSSRAAQELPQQAEQIAEATALYVSMAYGPGSWQEQDLRRLGQLVRSIGAG